MDTCLTFRRRPWYRAPVARSRFEQLPEERREEILSIAAAEFARSGFQGTSYNQLLERLQLGKSSAYYYFEDKRDLFLTALAHCYRTHFAMMRQLPRPTTAADFWDFIERTTVIGYEMMIEDPTAAHLMQCMQREKGLLGELGSSELHDSLDSFHEESLIEGQRLGAVRTDLPQRLLVSLAVDIGMAFDRWFITERERDPKAATPEDAARLFTDAARRLCGR
jgi:AcrR family transcriptional regulator